MARINLLPWREERRRERKQQFFGLLLAAAVLSALAVFAGRWYMSEWVAYQESRNEYLQNQIEEMDRRIAQIEALEETRAKLLARKEIIEELQTDRAEMVHLFDELARTIPDGVYLTGALQNGNILTLNGVAESNARVSAYMRNIEASDWLFTPKLEVIEAINREGEGRVRRFVLQVSTEPPEEQTAKEFEQQAASQ